MSLKKVFSKEYNPGELEENFKEVDLYFQRINHRVFSTVPSVADVREGELFAVDNGVTVKLYMKVNNVLKSVIIA